VIRHLYVTPINIINLEPIWSVRFIIQIFLKLNILMKRLTVNDLHVNLQKQMNRNHNYISSHLLNFEKLKTIYVFSSK